MSEKKLPERRVTFCNVREENLEVKMDIEYEAGKHSYIQPVVFTLCEMKWLGSGFHEEVMASLARRWQEASAEMSSKVKKN